MTLATSQLFMAICFCGVTVIFCVWFTWHSRRLSKLENRPHEPTITEIENILAGRTDDDN